MTTLDFAWTCPRCRKTRQKSARLRALSGGALAGDVPQAACLDCGGPIDYRALVAGRYDHQLPGPSMLEDGLREIGAIVAFGVGVWAAVVVHREHGFIATAAAFIGGGLAVLLPLAVIGAVLSIRKTPDTGPVPEEDVRTLPPAPPPRPLTPEESALIEKLIAVGRKVPDARSSSTYLNIGRRDAREIGEALNAQGGLELMLRAHDSVAAALGGVSARELEACWGGIGQWLS